MSVRAKLSVLFLIPLVVFLAVSAFQIAGSYQRAKAIESLQLLSELGIHISALIHETQKERGGNRYLFVQPGTTLFS